MVRWSRPSEDPASPPGLAPPDPDRADEALRADLGPLFDEAYYLGHTPSAARGAGALRHYLARGARQGRDPNPFFSTSFYLARNPDVAASGMNPLVHYRRHGGYERRDPGPRFDTGFYLAGNPDVAASGANPLAHFLAVGMSEGRAPLPPGPVPAGGARGAVVAAVEAPCGLRRVRTGEPVVVVGWCFAPGSRVTAVGVRWGEERQEASFPLERDDVAGHFSGEPHARWSGFETRIAFDAPGTRTLRLEAMLEDGRPATFAELLPIEVADDPLGEPALARFPTLRSFGVLYVDGLGPEFQSPRYRVHNLREALRLAGVRSGEASPADLYREPSRLRGWDLLVVFRAPWDHRLEAIFRQARDWRVPVVFDADDYVFEPAIARPEVVAGIDGWPPEVVEEYRRGVVGYRRTLAEADWFTGSTAYLVARARELGKPASLISNSASRRMLDVSRPLRRGLDRPRRQSGEVEVVYLSGTRTHQRDVAAVVPALARVLAARPALRLRIVGYLDLEEYGALGAFADRITTHGFVPWEELPALLAEADVMIAPLEAGNPFCEAKSELKWFEGALCGLPTVASATDPFRRAIVDGETGRLAATGDEWGERLLHLIDHPEERRGMARRAAVHAINRYGPVHTARQACRVYREVLEATRRRLGVDDRALVVNWLCPDPVEGSGGHNDIFIAANEMTRRGHRVTVHFPDHAATGVRAIREFVRRAFGYEPLFGIAAGFEALDDSDALIATHHSTADEVWSRRDRTLLPAYFVQDYEPSFYRVGAEHFAAEQTYRYGLLCITLGPWLRALLEARFGAVAREIGFWVDRRHYFPPASRRAAAGGPEVAFFARPHMPRRCYETGVEALRALSRQRPDVTISLFGASGFPGVDFPHRDLGILAPSQLGELYRRADVGLAFSTTNPSLATFEMMACGLPVVDLDVLDSPRRHGGHPAFLVDPSPAAVADALALLLETPEAREELSARSLEFTRELPGPEEALRGVSLIVEEWIGAGPTP